MWKQGKVMVCGVVSALGYMKKPTFDSGLDAFVYV
jgi:hypothetical protein